MLADYHLHTAFSDDSVTPMEDMVQRALALGFDEICFTEHVDYGVKTDLNCDYTAYFRTLRAMQAQYAGRISIRAGIEFGVQAGTVSQFEDDFARYPFDFVILSNHQVGNKEFWTYEFQEGRTQDEYQTAYYEAIYDVMRRYQSYSVLGHLDMIKRYDKCGAYPDEKVLPLIEPILRQAIADGKGIELNTSSFKYGLPDLMPSRRILRFYRELGGELLTIGSDSHETVHLGDHIREVRPILRDLGFRTFCTFERMKPVFHDL
ncbi:histidinol-phosphatase HisJ family protein [Butyricicoccus sp. 1XD8-22]|nr:histidinol-phosphatase HisJ family protein [Butyricicoccus sp. 1XD8-22]